jgi:hypothetical protein
VDEIVITDEANAHDHINMEAGGLGDLLMAGENKRLNSSSTNIYQ